MSTMGYTYHQCPACKKILVNFEELSNFKLNGDNQFSDGIEEHFSFWNSGYLKECPECKHTDLPVNFKIDEELKFNYETADPSAYNGLRPVNSTSKIEKWLSENKVSPKIEFNIRFSAYNRERIKDVEIKRGMVDRQKNARKIFDIAINSTNPELIFQSIEICRGSQLVTECIRLISKLENEFPEWNISLINQVKTLLGQSSFGPKMIFFSKNSPELRDIC